MARRYRFSMRKGVNIPRVVSKITATVLALYAGGIVVSELGNVMANTTSPFYVGLSLIGWTVETNDQTNGTAGWFLGCGGSTTVPTQTAATNCITDTGSAGILAVIGIIGIASIVMEFVQFRM